MTYDTRITEAELPHYLQKPAGRERLRNEVTRITDSIGVTRQEALEIVLAAWAGGDGSAVPEDARRYALGP